MAVLGLHSSLFSIHAPVKGATSPHQHAKAYQTISIHAPVKGATAALAGWGWCLGFQSTLP